MKLSIIIPNIYEMRRETAKQLLAVLYKIEDETDYRLKGVATAINTLQDSNFNEEGALEENQVVKDFLTTASDGNTTILRSEK